MQPYTPLIVDDEAKIRAIVRQALGPEARTPLEAETGESAIALAEKSRPDVIILDLGLPDMDGIEVCRAIRAWSSAPILILSARADEHEKVLVLEAGADDYVTKPFSAVELHARVQAQLRRAHMAPVPGTYAPVTIGDLTIDTASRQVSRVGQPIHLTPTEWALLRVLISHAGRPVTHRQLFSAVWGDSHGDHQLYLRVYVAHLRRKLETDPYRARIILTEPGVGYRFALDPKPFEPSVAQ